MVGSVSYTSSNILVCGNSSGYFTKLEFATQSLTSWGTDDVSTTGGLPSVSFTSGLTAINEFPFSLPTISVDASPEIGLLSYGSMSLECDNESISGIRMYSMLRNFDTDTEAMHVRFSYKQSATGDWIYRYWGVVDPKSITVECSNLTASDTYRIKFNAINNIELLQERSILQFANDKCKHQLNDYIANNKYISTIGSSTLANGSGTNSGGRYKLTRWFLNNDTVNPIGWLPGGSEDSSLIPLRWYRLVDIFKKASEYLGLELPINGDGDIYNRCTTLYGYNTGDDSIAMQFVTVDLLMYPVGVYTLANGQMLYVNLFGYFDESNTAPYSFYQYSNVLELLKGICVSLGLICSVEIDSTGQRYLKLVESGAYNTDTGIIETFKDGEDNISSDITFEPYFRKTSGVVVVPSIDSEVVRGIDNNDSVSIDGIFASTNHVIIATDTVVNPTTNTCTTRQDLRLLGSLWTSPTLMSATGSWNNTDGSAKVCTDIYSICAVIPKHMGQGSTLSGALYNQLYDFKVKNTTATLNYGEFQSTYGSYSVNAIMYPAISVLDGVNTYTELPQMGIAHYYFSPLNISTDEVGIYRKKSRSLNIKVSGIYPSIQINQKLIMKIEDSYVEWFVISIKENYNDFVTEYKLESRES